VESVDRRFEARVAAQIEQLAAPGRSLNKNLRELELRIARKRRHWLKESGLSGLRDRWTRRDAWTPRAAFELLFFDYMRVAREDLEIVEQTPVRITWLSRNPCPTLEACRRLQLDTRTVCKGALEKSTQAFLSQFDPRLRFIRDYGEIRPHAAHCRESIVRMDFDEMMRRALTQARLSLKEDDGGYGAVLTMGETVIAEERDTCATHGDPSLHAELKAIRQASKALGTTDLCGAILFSTCEPCPMCAALAVWSNVTSIVYGASIPDTVRAGRSRIEIRAVEIAEKGPALVEVVGGVLKDECEALYTR
jgi:tRNA(adenine34) deaminase